MDSTFHFIWSARLTSLTTLILAVFVLLKNRRREVNLVFALYCSFISLWSFCIPFHVTAATEALSVRWVQLLHMAAFFIPTGFVHFVYAFVRADKRCYKRLILFYAVSLMFGVIGFTPLMVKGAIPRYGLNYLAVPGPLYIPAMLFFISLVVHGTYCLGLIYKRSQGTKRNQMRYLFWGTVVGYLGGINNFIILYNIAVFPFYPFGTYAIALYVLVTAYAIIKHRLMDIEVIIRKTLVFTGLSAMVMAVVGSITTVSQQWLSRYWIVPAPVSMGLSVLAAILFYEPTKNLLVHLTDRFLFQKKQTIKEVLRRLSGRIITILNLGEVAKTILETFEESLRAETGAILLKTQEGYQTLQSYGVESALLEKVYSLKDPLMEYLARHQTIIRLEDEEVRKKLPVLLLARLEDLKAVMAVPLFLHDELIGVLTLGKKKSDQEYTAEEIDYFPTVASQVAIALSNARLYHESIEARKKIEEMQIELIHREKMAFVADLVKGIAHEVFNPLTPVFHAVDLLEKSVFVKLVEVLKAEEEHMKGQSVESYLSALQDLQEVLRGLQINTQHIYHVIDTLSKMQKDDKETIGPLDFKIFLKDSRALIGMELHEETREIPVTEDVPRSIPPIKGNPTLLSQVFVNLFKNAIHAMEKSPKKEIRICAELLPRRPDFVRIDFTDTGSGIPADLLPKVFEFGFTTKGKKGQGIGLNQCRLIIQKFGGEITCSSKVGEGTTFSLTLPIWKGGIR